MVWVNTAVTPAVHGVILRVPLQWMKANHEDGWYPKSGEAVDDLVAKLEAQTDLPHGCCVWKYDHAIQWQAVEIVVFHRDLPRVKDGFAPFPVWKLTPRDERENLWRWEPVK